MRPEDNLSASAPDASAPGRRVRFFKEGREIRDSELPLQRAVAENRAIEPMELEVCLPSGRRWFTEASGAPICDAQGNVVGGVAVTVDITERKRAEDEILQNREWLRVTLTSIGDAVLACDAVGRVTFINPVATSLTGWTAEEALGQPVQNLFKIINEKTREPGENLVARVLREKRVATLANNTTLIARDGREIPVEDSAAPIMDAAGNVVGVVLVFHDVSEKRRTLEALKASQERARDQAAHLRAVMDAAPAVICTAVDRECRLISGNQAGQQLLGLPEGTNISLTGGTPDQVAHFRLCKDGVELAPQDLPIQRVAATGEPLVDYSMDCVFNDGRVRSLFGNVAPLFDADGQTSGAVGVFVDVTDRMRFEEMLQNANAALASKNAEMEQFLHTVSHDLKSPLVTIQGFLSYISSDAANGRFDRVAKYSERIQSAATRMAGLIGELLDFSRIGQVAKAHTRIELSALAREVIGGHAAELAKGGIATEIQSDMPIITADRERIYQVLDNLVVNAIKYGSSASQPRIAAGGRRETDEIRIFVRDSGKGIAPGFHQKVFELFQRLSTDTDGAGVGLAIVKRIVEVHGGRVGWNPALVRGRLFGLPSLWGKSLL